MEYIENNAQTETVPNMDSVISVFVHHFKHFLWCASPECFHEVSANISPSDEDGCMKGIYFLELLSVFVNFPCQSKAFQIDLDQGNMQDDLKDWRYSPGRSPLSCGHCVR